MTENLNRKLVYVLTLYAIRTEECLPCYEEKGINSELSKEHMNSFFVWQMAHYQFSLSFNWSPNCISHSASSRRVARGSNFKISGARWGFTQNSLKRLTFLFPSSKME